MHVARLRDADGDGVENSNKMGRTYDPQELCNPETSEVDYTDEELIFLKAIDRYKREQRRPYPTWREVLRVLTSLGYRRVAEVEPLPEMRKSRRKDLEK